MVIAGSSKQLIVSCFSFQVILTRSSQQQIMTAPACYHIVAASPVVAVRPTGSGKGVAPLRAAREIQQLVQAQMKTIRKGDAADD